MARRSPRLNFQLRNSRPWRRADAPDAVRASLVDAAAVSGGLWITYLGILVYLLIAIGSVSHKDLLLESPIKLPLVSVDLPMTGFFWLGPVLFLIVHVYVLLHFVLLTSKVTAYNNVLVSPNSGLDLRAWRQLS